MIKPDALAAKTDRQDYVAGLSIIRKFRKKENILFSRVKNLHYNPQAMFSDLAVPPGETICLLIFNMCY
jgi:hypothetical protein